MAIIGGSKAESSGSPGLGQTSMRVPSSSGISDQESISFIGGHGKSSCAVLVLRKSIARACSLYSASGMTVNAQIRIAVRTYVLVWIVTYRYGCKRE
ncbi:hypothetical protein K440DRAFT_630645 [Wilcoxina mikolae CBS 423.85]|nr:hypothetical protein K440DRAFT_630645 [Wilcoxina mikolae CBS 423.85]